MDEINHKELFDQDIQILIARFEKFSLDKEERHWHYQRYFVNLSIDSPEILEILRSLIEEKISEIDNEDASHPDKKDNIAYQVLNELLAISYQY